MKNKYEYVVKYHFKHGVGTMNWTMNKPIKSFKDINDIKIYLEKTYKFENVGVESYILVRKSERKRKFIK